MSGRNPAILEKDCVEGAILVLSPRFSNFQSPGSPSLTLVKVQSVSKTRVKTVTGNSYNRVTGRLCGAGDWVTESVRSPEPGEIEFINASIKDWNQRVKIAKLARELSAKDLALLDMEQCTVLLELLTQIEAAKSPQSSGLVARPRA